MTDTTKIRPDVLDRLDHPQPSNTTAVTKIQSESWIASTIRNWVMRSRRGRQIKRRWQRATRVRLFNEARSKRPGESHFSQLNGPAFRP